MYLLWNTFVSRTHLNGFPHLPLLISCDKHFVLRECVYQRRRVVEGKWFVALITETVLFNSTNTFNFLILLNGLPVA